MARFRIGMCVRIKYSIGWPELAGEEGTIVEPSTIGVGPCLGRKGWRVSPDIWGSYRAPYESLYGATYFCPIEDQLEPITDSYDLVSWESMRDLWVPEHLREDA